MTKKLIYTFFAVMVCAVCTGQQMAFDRKAWDFGTIREADGPVSYTFRFTNKGKTPLVIERVEVNCGCTTTDFSREPVMPGKTGRLSVTFDPAHRPGPFNKTIVVTANNRSLQVKLAVTGTVQERVKTIGELYPVDLGGGVRIDTRAAYFRSVAQGDVKSMVVRMVNTSPDARTIGVQADPAYPQLTVNAPATICAGCKRDLTVTFDLTGKKAAYGVFSSNIEITVNGKQAPTPISAVAYGVDDFGTNPDVDQAPRARFDRQYHDFADIKPDTKPLPATFTLTDTGAATLIVRHVKCGNGLTTDLRAGTAIGAGKSVKFTVTLDPSQFAAGPANQSIVIIVNDPLRPVREVRIAAEIR